MVLLSSCSTVLLISGSTTGGRHSMILHVYTQRLRASVVLQYTREHWYPIGKSLSSQSERSFRIPKQSIVIEPIITWTLSGSKPLRNFLRKLIPSKSTNTLLKTSNPFSGTTSPLIKSRCR